MATLPCTLMRRHKWSFVKNVTRTYPNGRTVQVSTRGLYKCACGARKYGEYGIEQ